VVTVDDDVTVPPDWLEKLIAPMIRPEVMVVTGNVLPLELETPAQWMFETLKGGLGAGFNPFEADRAWWDSFQHSAPPVWKLGVSANAAFRATIFSHPAIGMMDEILGPGTPTVGGEENHLIYKVLRAGYTVVYEPSAQVWHRHRRDLKALYKQVYGHMKGGTAYHLLLWLQEKDPRGWKQLFIVMPRYLRDYVIDRMLGKHQMPWRIMRSEISGYLAGFWGYWQSAQRLKRLGRSDRYIPVEERDRSAPPITMQKKITSDPGGSQIHLEPVSQESQCP
jgi:O-antigen biosynthesis protein